MNKAITTIAALLLPALASSASGIQAPSGWNFVGQNDAGYQIELDQSPFGAASALISSGDSQSSNFGGIGQSISADSFAGKRIRLSARFKAQEVNGWSGLWLRIDDGSGKVLLLDNMADRAVYGTKPWSRQQIIVDVPTNSKRIAFGAILSGSGKAWVDDFVLIEAPGEGPVTATPSSREIYNEAPAKSLPTAPINSDFES